jgi:hypothetical protein
MSDPTPNIAPAAIAQPGETGGPPFVLAGSEWLAIQNYVTDGLALPTDMPAFAKSLGPGAPSDLSDFNQIVTAYQAINGHCATWHDVTFPATVSLASDVYDYGANKAPVYYPAILTEANILVSDPTNAQALAALKAILDNLQATANGYATKAAAVAQQVTDFANQTAADQTTLVGPKGDAGLVKYYNDKYGATSAQVVEFQKQLGGWRDSLDKANADYRYDVIVAATTPTYGWIWPFGTIAAAVVAGVYGSRATADLAAAKAAQAQIDQLNNEISADANLMSVIQLAVRGVTKIATDIAAALPAVQKVQGVWGGIRDDITNITNIIENDIEKALPIIMSLGVDEAVKAWSNVATAANNYRLTAYVQPAPGLQSMLAWKVQTQIASDASQALAA